MYGRMIKLSKKLLAILISVVLVVSCMMIPAMAADLSWNLSNTEDTTIEMEWFFSGGTTEQPNSNWLYNKNASNDYLYSTIWEADDMIRTFSVVSNSSQYYDVEFVAGVGEDKSTISVYVGDTLVGDTHTDEGTELYKIDDESIRLYKATRIPLNEGNNTVRVCTTKQYSTRPYRNAYKMDYIKFTPIDEELALAVSAIEDNTINATQLGIIFNKPITDATGITATASSGTATIAVDATNTNRVKITGVAGRVNITVPAGFTGGLEEDATTEVYTASVFAYPYADVESKNKPAKELCDPAIGQVAAYAGATSGMMDIMWRSVLAVYDGDKLIGIAGHDKNLWGATENSRSVTLGADVKFTEAKAFGFWILNNEWIPLDKPVTRTAAELGFTFE